MTGAGLDLVVGGSSFFLGTLIGGVVGGVGAMFGFDNLYEVKVLGQNLGKRELTIGPMQNLNFPYVLLGRALYHALLMAKRSHAVRSRVELENSSFTEQIITADMRKSLEKIHYKLRKAEELKEEELTQYQATLKESFKQLLS